MSSGQDLRTAEPADRPSSLDGLVRMLRGGGIGNAGLIALWPAILVIFTVAMPGQFLQLGTLQAMMFQLPELGLLSLALVIPLISGGLNLAIIATSNQAALLMVWILSTQMPVGADAATTWLWIGLALVAGLALCVFIGWITGLLVAVAGVHPILVTLGTMTLINGISIFLTRGTTLSGLPEPVLFISNGTILGVPLSFILFVLVAIAIHILLTRMPLGIRIHMAGSNLAATRYSGVNTNRVLISVYVLSSVLCWMAAVVMMARFNSAGADFAESYLLITVLAAILGGVDPYGGSGRVSGLFLALLILQTVASGFNLLGLSPQLTLACWGLILLLVIAVKRLTVWLSERRSI
jgi:simple sugar transport system permease protein